MLIEHNKIIYENLRTIHSEYVFSYWLVHPKLPVIWGLGEVCPENA
jgi:hypothetical protein